MTINPAPLWGSSYQSTWDKVFKDAQGPGFNAIKATQDAWQKWNNDNAKGIQFVPPLLPHTLPPFPPLSGTTKEKTFAPVDFSNSRSAPESAKILASAWQTWALSITWPMVPPAPPYSAVLSIITDPGSLSAAYSKLLADLITEMAIVPQNEPGVQTKYKNLGTIFFTAVSSLKVQVIGLDLTMPTPLPLTISVPVF